MMHNLPGTVIARHLALSDEVVGEIREGTINVSLSGTPMFHLAKSKCQLKLLTLLETRVERHNPPTNVNLYLSAPNFVQQLKASGRALEKLKTIRKYLVADRLRSFEECIEWARLKFEDDYVNEIKQLLYNLRKDQVSTIGALLVSVRANLNP